MKNIFFIQRRLVRPVIPVCTGTGGRAGFSVVGSFRGTGLFIIFCFAVKCDVCVAQAGEWTWMKGSSGNAPFAVFGTQGVANAANTPQGFYEPCEWRDNDGAFWLYGGIDENSGMSSNLWKYDPSTNQWTWVKGPGNPINQLPVYGTQGVPALSNTPGARGWCVSSWVDNFGDLWLLGGRDPIGGNGYGDLWRYHIPTNEWTWMKGSTTPGSAGIYGTQTVFNSANYPGGRSETCATWTDANNNLWLFGGYGSDQNGTTDLLNDVWKYDVNTNEWAWMRGSKFVNDYGSYGTKGVTDTTNNPPSRMVYTKWKDADGNFWIFAGGDFFSGYYYNDVWKYEPAINKWTWMSGPDITDDNGTTGALCTPDIDWIGPARFENRTCWTDSCGSFWTWGGARGISVDENYNDLWNFNSQTLEWTMVDGSVIFNQSGSYGTQGVSSPFNEPPSRGGSTGWIGADGSLWMLGGTVNFITLYNDLWRYIIDPSCPELIACSPPVAPNFSASDAKLCQKFCISFYDSSQNNPIAWQWLFPGGTPASSINQNPVNICYQTPGVFDVTLITTNANGTDTFTLHNYITVYPTPAFPTVTQVGYTLTSSAASSYQWQLNTVDIPGATNQSYTILQSGYYTVIVGDSNSCKNSFTLYVLISAVNDVMSAANISISPNPSNGNFTVEFTGLTDEVSIEVVNTVGQIIFSSTESPSSGTSPFKKEIDLRSVSAGIYIVEIKTKDVSVRKKIVIE